MGRVQLFDDNGDSSDDLSEIEINHEYAKRHEYNKKREDLQRYEELKKKGRVDDSSSEASSEEKDEELFKPSKKTDSKFFDALIKVKNKDPILRNKDAKLFGSDSDSESGSDDESEEGMKGKKKKPMYLKDVVSKQLIEEGPEFDDEAMGNGDSDETEKKVKSYSEEQEEIRRNVLKAMKAEEDDEEGDLFREKNDGSMEAEEEEDIGEKLDMVFGEDGKLDENTKFLKDYFKHRMWIDNTKRKDIGDEDIEFSEDEEEIEKQEDYEREYNFRFEEDAGDRVMGHSRKVEGTVRKKENARKAQRERKEERMVQAEFERKEELKRLKNLKKKEINEKLEKIRKVAGMGQDRNISLNEDDLEEEFDPREHDKKMQATFGDDYYMAGDADPQFASDGDEDGDDFEKPDFDKEDELLGLPKGWDDVASGEDGDDEPKEGKRKRKRKPSEVEKAVGEQLMEEYYKLDYEDTIGDLKTRFKYKGVASNRFGLTPKEILTIDDKDLNQYVPLKKIAPYQEKEHKVPHTKKIQMKEKFKEQHSGRSSNSTNKHMKKTENDHSSATKVVGAVENEKHATVSGGDTSTVSRRSKRRQRQKEYKLSQSRIKAYGDKSKSKKQ